MVVGAPHSACREIVAGATTRAKQELVGLSVIQVGLSLAVMMVQMGYSEIG